MKADFPKILIISHNVIGLDGNMGKTLHSYFNGWPTDKLCQLYFHSEVPTTHLCESYYRVTDFDLLHALGRFKRAGTVLTGKDVEVDRVTTRTDTGRAASIYQKGRQRKPWMYFARNSLWKLGVWKNKRLDKWICQCKPDVIFYASGDYVFSFEIVLYLSQKYKLPLVISVVDDYYFHRPQGGGVLGRWNTLQFRRVMEKTMERAKGALYVHPQMELKYREVFQVNSGVLYKTAPLCTTEEPRDGALRVSYFGGLGLKRDEAVAEIGRAVKTLIPDGSVLVDVYSSESDPDILAGLTEENGIRFLGMLSAEEVLRVQAESNILVFAESSAPELFERLRYSLSTKIPEYLGSNRCMLAYGPAEAGSISYLLENQVACVATEPEQLLGCLEEILFSPDARRQYARRQMALAMENHREERNHEVLKKLLNTAAND